MTTTQTSSSRRVRLPLAVVQDQPEVEPPDWGAARCLIAATATAALAGIPLGLLLGYWSGTGRMGQVPWVGLVQAHGQVQLFGWIGLAILGVTFHAMAHLFQTAAPPARLTWAVLLLQLAGVALRLAAPMAPWAPEAPGALGAWLLLASSLAFLGAFLVTMEAHVRTLPRRDRSARPPAILPRYLLTGLALWCLALFVNLDGAIQAVRVGAVAAGALDATHDALLVAMTSGGLTMIALGMSLRVVVGWLDLPAPHLGRAAQAWWLLAAAVLLRALRPAVETLAPAASGVSLGAIEAVLGDTVWVAAVVWYLPALRGLWSPGAVTRGGGARGESDPSLAWYVRTAHAWLGVSALLAAAEVPLLVFGSGGAAGAVVDAGRHAVLFGFLGLLTAGLSGRLPTAFLEVGERGVAATRHPYAGAFALLAAASVLRVGAPLVRVAWPGAYTAVLVGAGTTGALGLCCLLGAIVRIGWLARQMASAQRAGHRA